MKLIILIIGLASMGHFESMALRWAKAHNLEDPGVTCVITSSQKAHCDISSYDEIYPLTCDSGKGGCFYNDRRR